MSGGQSNQGTRGNRSAVNGWSPEYIEQEYSRFLADPASVPPDMRSFFQGFDLALASQSGGSVAPASPFQSAVDELVAAYRDMGHIVAKTDPFGRVLNERPPTLSLSHYGLSEADLDRTVEVPPAGMGMAPTLREVIARLEAIYCGSIGVEFMHIHDERERSWFISKFEGGRGPSPLTRDQKSIVLEQLTSAECFDKFLGKRYQGKKRFSLEGGESLITLLKWMTQTAGELGTQEIIVGMPHRGRLSVLRNYLGKDLEKLFTEFEDSWSDGNDTGAGDVKYHRGYSGDQDVGNGKLVHLSMLNNPSHLESVNAVVLGKTRAKQDLVGDSDRRRVVSLLIHGDAAVAGQGVVAECLNMSQLEGYTVGGTLHIVVNNLVGFTTDWSDSRSTRYCTDIGKFVNAPVFHVNADDPEAVVAAAKLAAEFRHEFRRDVFVDLVCFRRYGHNEQDEPNYTQPGLYALVRSHPGTPETYRQKLISTGEISAEAATKMVDDHNGALDAAQTLARKTPTNPVPPPGGGYWKGIQGKYTFENPKTAVDAATIAEICSGLGRAPEGFNVHPKLKGLLQARAALPQTKKLSHADAEQIAIASLLLDGYPVRLSGQDCRRGTFTQRHAVLRDEKSGEKFTPANAIRADGQAKFQVWDSPLSEYAVVGFDYGYSRAIPKALVMWEAQFGDFANTAQVMMDQYLSSSETKWRRWAGLVLLLPHGYEGQGPEHSSAKLERFLQMCAEDNMEVVYPSTGAQLFHMLRRQVMRDFRKPLIVMTPKKFLRTETSMIEELSTSEFKHLIDDASCTASEAAKNVKQVVYCSGKFYHEMADRRSQTGRSDVALIRVEQLYPFHAKMAAAIDARYPKSAKRVWAQEEPRNQGAYLFIADQFRESLGVNLNYVGRAAAASPATGSEYTHKHEQSDILDAIFGPVSAADPHQTKSESNQGHAAAVKKS